MKRHWQIVSFEINGINSVIKKTLMPIENKCCFFDVSAEALGTVDPIFYGDLRTAAIKALGLN